jgi:hypothetical protein
MSVALSKYTDLWDSLTPRQRSDLCFGAFSNSEVSSDDRSKLSSKTLTYWLAKQLRYRPETLMRRDTKYRASQLEPRVRRGFAQTEWRLLLANGAAWGFPAATEVISKELGFDDGESLEFSYHAEHGTPEQWSTAFLAAANSPNTAPEVYALAECISLTGLGWDFLEPIKPDLKKRSQDALAEAASILPVPAEPLVAVSSLTALPENDGSKEPGPSVAFTTLDQVVIDQIIATAAQSQGALSPDDLDDFLQTIISLSLKVAKAYHHLGLADALLKDRHLDWQRDEFNDERRGWYLVGALTAYVRRQKHESVLELILSRQQDFDALYQPGNITGQFAANALSPYLLSKGMILEAANLIGPHVGKYCVPAIRQLLVRSADRLRTGQVSDVSPVIEALFLAAPQLAAIPSHGASLLRMTKRLMAQVCQARGEFDAARMILIQLRQEELTSPGSGILADLALVEAGIANVTDLRLPDEQEARVQLRAALGSSESMLRQSATGDQPSSRGCLALAVLDYLTWTDSRNDNSLIRALATVRLALATVRATREGSVYQDSGLVGQCQFMESVLLMNRLTDHDAQLAFTVWQRIPASAGHLPSIDISLLLQAAQAVSQPLTAKLVESLAVYGRSDSNAFLRDPVILTHSPALLERALASIDDASVSDREKWDRLVAILAAAVQCGSTECAENALNYLQKLALHGSCLSVAREWFSQEANYQAVWDVDDATWIRAEIAHCQGDLVECGLLLAQLFWLENHRNREAAEDILTLMQDWRIPGDIRDPCVFGLVETTAPEALPGATEFDRNLAVRIVFVGGNETQERYDEYVRETVTAAWPNVQVEFFHTGWSANWGRDLSNIVRTANAADAVVIMRFVRTMLGRSLRSQIAKPWFPCTGHGRTSVLGTIERAIMHLARANAA